MDDGDGPATVVPEVTTEVTGDRPATAAILGARSAPGLVTVLAEAAGPATAKPVATEAAIATVPAAAARVSLGCLRKMLANDVALRGNKRDFPSGAEDSARLSPGGTASQWSAPDSAGAR